MSVDLDKLRAEIVEATRNSVYAELRRSGALKKSAVAAMEGRSVDKPAPAQQAPQVDVSRLRQLDRALGALGLTDKLSDRAYQRAERAFLEESPEDAREWAKDYFSIAAAATQSVPQTNTARPQSDSPVTDRGSPAPPRVNLDGIDLLTASDDDRQAFVRAKGPHAYKALLTKQVAGRKFDLKR